MTRSYASLHIAPKALRVSARVPKSETRVDTLRPAVLPEKRCACPRVSARVRYRCYACPSLYRRDTHRTRLPRAIKTREIWRDA